MVVPLTHLHAQQRQRCRAWTLGFGALFEPEAAVELADGSRSLISQLSRRINRSFGYRLLRCAS